MEWEEDGNLMASELNKVLVAPFPGQVTGEPRGFPKAAPI